MKWPPAPLHSFNERGTYMVTASTYNKVCYFKKPEELNLLHDSLLGLAEQYRWKLEAWAVFPNHYHFIAQSPQDAATLRKFISHVHSASARQLNHQHNTPGRKVWFQYWDSRITFHHSYLARLNYVMQNPVKHKIVPCASQYFWCSAHWFEINAEAAYFKTVTNVKFDQVNVVDDF